MLKFAASIETNRHESLLVSSTVSLRSWFTFLRAHMGKFLEEWLFEFNLFFSRQRYQTAFSRSVKGRMAPLPMPRDYLDAFKFPSEPNSAWFIFRG